MFMRRMPMTLKPTFLFIVLSMLFNPAFGGTASPSPDPNFHKVPQEAVEAWKDLKFGLRIHWGLYCMDPDKSRGESWKLENYAKNTTSTGPSDYKRYQDWYKTFNPVQYDPGQWLDQMTASGMTFFTFTTKHHEGFCMFNTAQTVHRVVVDDSLNPGRAKIVDPPQSNWHYSIMDTPYGRDVTAMLVQAAAGRSAPAYAQGIPKFRIGLYYTDIDWYDADFRFGNRHPLYSGGADASYTSTADPAGYERAYQKYFNEVDQICKMVPKNDLLSICFDMSFPNTTACNNMIHDMVMNARAQQPNALFRSRCIGSAYGDYDTPERTFSGERPATDNWMVIFPLARNFDWDPIAANYLTKKDSDGSTWPGHQWVVRHLVDVVARGGNFQIGLGPSPEGKFHSAALGRKGELDENGVVLQDDGVLIKVGQWLEKNHECIYSTRQRAITHEQLAGADNIWFSRTKDENFVYVMCKMWPGNSLTLKTVKAVAGTPVTLLANDNQTPIPWTASGTGMTIDLSGVQPFNHLDVGCGVWVFKVQTGLLNGKKNQTITFNPLPGKAVGDADFNPGAAASSNLPVSYASSDTTVAKIVDGRIQIVAAGAATITASQAGDSIYNPADPVSRTLTVRDPFAVTMVNDRTIGANLNQFEYIGTWTVIASQAGNYQSDFTQSDVAGNYLNFRFSGTQIILYGKKKPDSGIAAFSIDGGTESEGDFYAAAETKMAKVWESPILGDGNHTLKCRILGTKNAASTGYLCRFDYVEIVKAHSTSTGEERKTDASDLPSDFVLNQNYPNPFNPTTVIRYQLPVAGYVQLKVYDMLGREIAVLADGMREAGSYRVQFLAKGGGGSNRTSGVYLTRLTIEPQEGTSRGKPIVRMMKIVLSK